MNRTQFRHALESVTNASVLLACVVAIVVLVRGPFSLRLRSSRAIPEELQEGEAFPKRSESGATMYRLVPQTIYVGSTTSLAVQVQADNLAYWIDHGTHENITKPPVPPQ